MAKVKSIYDYKVTSGDRFLFDNNVWMILFSPIANANERQQKIYGRLLRDITSARATIFINALIVSEYVNRSFRLNYELWKLQETKAGKYFVDYKRDYRESEAFEDARQDIVGEMAQILSVAEKKPDDFNALNPLNILRTKGMDFNDGYYSYYCQLNNLILVTDDKDLQNTSLDITILTT
ncbi:MAG: hypothetical protein K2J63_03330 [Muribaculaceae bacterium]|nr:hypothetical protein [Muribaculaceae bacterium]